MPTARYLTLLVLAPLSWLTFAPQLAHSQQPVMLGTYAGDFDEMERRRLIRVLVPFSKTIYFIDKGVQLGTAVDFGTELEKVLNTGKKKEIDKIRIAFVPTPRNELFEKLNAGRGDIIMANLTVTPARQKQADFSEPFYDKASEILVTGPGAPDVRGLDDLAGKEIRLRQSSSYFEHLTTLNAERHAAGKPEIVIKPMDENLEDEDILEMVNTGLLPWTIVDDYKANIWKTVFTDLRLHADITVSTGGQVAWAIRKESPLLKARLDAFAKDHRIGTTFGNMLKNRYFKADKMLRRAYAPSEMEKFEKLVGVFRKYAGQYSFDYLLVLAQGYQESQLDQARRSARGAVGIMQLLPSTAADKAIGIKDIASTPDRNIEAGNKYLRYLITTYISDPNLSDRDRLLFAFAAYNAGPGNLKKFRAKAKAMGLDENRWFGNVENGAAAIVGRETVQYVSNIYKYYVAYSLVAEHAAPPNDATVTGSSKK